MADGGGPPSDRTILKNFRPLGAQIEKEPEERGGPVVFGKGAVVGRIRIRLGLII